jgi:N-acetylglutamate synthase
MDRDLLLRIERAGVNAWPALETAGLDGWLWRFSDGGSQRGNSVSALAFTGKDAEASINEAERRYTERGVKSMFQVSDVADPAGLDERLAKRGYWINDPCTTLVREAAAGVPPPGIEYLDRATPEWFVCYSSVITPERKRVAPQILMRIPPGSVFCALRRDGRIVATALGVPHDGIIIAECVATLAEARGTGAARQVMRGLEVWGAARDCRLAALQALVHNAPAQALYKSLGYKTQGGYHLRVKDLPA